MTENLKDQCRAAFQAAQNATTPCLRQFAIGDKLIRLDFAGDALAAKLSAAFEHLAQPDQNAPDLTIHLWDSATTGAPSPPLPAFEGNQAWLMNGEHTSAFCGAPGEQFYLLDLQHNEAYFWSASPNLPQPECGSPLIPILHWWLQELGWLFLHGAAVGTPELGAALIVGRGGRGKSSTALACLDSSLRYLADDYCLARPDGSLHTLYCSAKAGNSSLKRMPYLETARSPFTDASWEKNLFFLNNGFADRLIRTIPARCVLVASVSGETNTWAEPIRPALALTALAPSTLFQLRFSRDTGALLSGMRSLVERLPCFTLHLGTDRAQIPKAIERTLEQCA